MNIVAGNMIMFNLKVCKLHKFKIALSKTALLFIKDNIQRKKLRLEVSLVVREIALHMDNLSLILSIHMV